MSKIEIIKEHELENYIKEALNSVKTSPINIENADYHHNTSYENAPFNIRYGLMSTTELMKYGRVSKTDEQLSALENDPSSVNGIYEVSLSKVGLTDQYREDEWEWEPRKGRCPDFLIDSDIKTRRVYTNYFNEFLAEGIILPEKFRAIDVRILNVCNDMDKTSSWSNREKKIEALKVMYNQLGEMAKAMKEMELGIPLREMSNEDNMALDIDRVSEFPKINLVRK